MSTTGISPNCIRCGVNLLGRSAVWNGGAPYCSKCAPFSEDQYDIERLRAVVSQLLERVKKLEEAWRDANSTKKRGDWEKPMGLELKPASEAGHHIARALEKMK